MGATLYQIGYALIVKNWSRPTSFNLWLTHSNWYSQPSLLGFDNSDGSRAPPICHFSVVTAATFQWVRQACFFASTLPRFRVSLHFHASALPQSTCRTEVRHMKFGFLKLILGESNSGPLGYGRDVISNRLCAHCQKLKPAHQLTIFDSRIVIDIVNLDKGFDNSDTGPFRHWSLVPVGATHELSYFGCDMNLVFGLLIPGNRTQVL